MTCEVVKYLIIDKEYDVEITSEIIVENTDVLPNNELTLRTNHSIAARGWDKLVWFYNKLHFVTLYSPVVQFFSADLRKDQLLLEDNVLAMRRWVEYKPAYFSLGAALVCVKPSYVFVTARPSAIVRCLLNGEVYYERPVEGRWVRV